MSEADYGSASLLGPPSSRYTPDRIYHTAQATRWCADYFEWYNFSHHHSGLAGFTSEQVFNGRYKEIAIITDVLLETVAKAKTSYPGTDQAGSECARGDQLRSVTQKLLAFV